MSGTRDWVTMAKRRRYDFLDEDFLARLERIRLAGKHVSARQLHGARRSRRVGDGLEFADHRAYCPGDDMRFVDWPYYARMEKLLLRLFHEHSESDVGILLDVSASMAPGGAMGKFDFARRAAAALTYVAMGNFERVWIVPFADEAAKPLRAGRNRAQIFRVLDFLAELSPGGTTRLGHCVKQFVRGHPQPGTLLIISDLLDCQEDLSDALARLGQSGCDVTMLHLYSQADADPQLSGSTVLQQAESDERLSLEITKDLLARYRDSWREFRTACERTCLARGVTYVPVDTDSPFERLVLFTLRQAGVLAG